MQEQIHKILGITESYKASERIMEVLKSDLDVRNAIFKQFLELFKYNVDIDWFHEYFQEEHADRKVTKQDFTPMEVGNLLASIASNDGYNRLDVCSGTGGLTIAKWAEDRIRVGLIKYKPSMFMYQCDEISDRTIPFLLLNLMIRGMNAKVVHGDVLEKTVKATYYTINEEDNFLGFSGLLEIK